MKCRTILQLLFFLTLLSTVSIAAEKIDWSAPGPFSVETIEFPGLKDDARAGRNIPIKVHLPKNEGACPLVVVSHGAGGNWDANFAQAHHLATHGFVVLCVEHIGSNTAVIKRGFKLAQNLKEMTRDSTEVLGRPKDITFALDRAEEWNQSHEKLRGRIDMKHVGIMGHSFGAYTTLVECGMRPALNWLTPEVPPGKGVSPDLSDPRIQCGVALSPQGPGEPFFIEESYATLKKPLLGITGTKDQQQNSTPENRRKGFELWPATGDKIFIILANADHLAFSDSTGSGRIGIPSFTREDAEPVVRAAMLQFFTAYLKQESGALKLLTLENLKPYCHGRVNDLEVVKK